MKLRLPYIMNLRRDPFERADFNSNTYLDWMVDHVPQLYLMQAVVASEISRLRQVPAAPEAGLVQSGRGVGAGVSTPQAELTAPRVSPGATQASAGAICRPASVA